ncbi:MAG: SNF2-related protein [Cyanobacteria bacterium P01_D01_bin.36]
MLSELNLKDYQIAGRKLLVNKRNTALFIKPGGGKTVTTLYALKDLAPQRTLIIAPLRVCTTVWAQEAANWEELQSMTFAVIRGTPAKREELLGSKVDCHLINYELLPWLAKTLTIHRYYDAIVFDELSMLKSPTSKRFRAIRGQVHKVPIKIGLTGTPTGNSLLGLWSQVYSVTGAKCPLTTRYTQFKANYFYQGGFEGKEWLPYADTAQKRFPGRNSHKEIMKALEGHVFSFEPSKEYCPIEYVPVSVFVDTKTQKLYQRLRDEFCLELESGADISAVSAAVLKNKLRQFESGAIYADVEPEQEKTVEFIHAAKLDALNSLIEELDGDPLLIVYEFKHELWRIQKQYPNVCADITPSNIERWNRGEIPLMAIHPLSAGHGLNLQHGGCNMVFMTAPWSLELWQQTVGRIYRSGQKRSVSIYTFKGFEVEGLVYEALKQHKNIESKTFSHLRVKQCIAA